MIIDTVKLALVKENGKSLKLVQLSQNVFKCEVAEKKKYIVFEPQEVYTKIESLISFLKELEIVQPETILRIPFFSAIDSKELSLFLFDEERDIMEFEEKISFDIVPADFNCQGYTRFLNYMAFLYRFSTPSLNDFNEYKKYFVSLIQEKENIINRVLSTTQEFHDSEAMQNILIELKD